MLSFDETILCRVDLEHKSSSAARGIAESNDLSEIERIEDAADCV